MIFLFTKSDNFGSFLIRWGTSKSMFGLADCSHVAVAFGDHIIHSTFEKGIHSIKKEAFLNKYQVVAAFQPREVLHDDIEKSIFLSLAKIKESAYDLSAILYFAWRSFLRKFFEKPYPETNKMNVSEMFFCTEVASIVKSYYWSMGNKIILPGLEKENVSMIDPQTLLDVCSHDGAMEEAKWSG